MSFVKLLLCVVLMGCAELQAQSPDLSQHPFIWADVPDMAITRVDDTYYMSSTTMHMSPGLPIMKSNDLIHWELQGYVYDRLTENDKMNLDNGQNAYGAGSWASSIRHHNGMFYVSTFSSTSGKTHIYHTRDIEAGDWIERAFAPALHDHSLFFDDDGRVYLVYGSGSINLVELKSDLSGPLDGKIAPKTIIENASLPAGDNIGLAAEGSQMIKANGKYYLFNITWPKDDIRVAVVHRADRIEGPYEGRVFLKDRGIAQGSIIDSPEGDWYAYLFRDYGAVGRVPYLIPVSWKDGWPVTENRTIPSHLPSGKLGAKFHELLGSDEFDREPSEASWPLFWQWNHNPDNEHWSLKEHKGYLRIRTSRIDPDVLNAKNTLTQRSFGPQSSANTAIDIDSMKNGDYAGLMALQKEYAFIGVKKENNKFFVVAVSNEEEGKKELMSQEIGNYRSIYLRLDFDFSRDVNDQGLDQALLYWSADGVRWNAVDHLVKLHYTLPHFMGYRFALFNFSTEEAGGYVDFDYFRVNDGDDNL